jgi:hypothetical protein
MALLAAQALAQPLSNDLSAPPPGLIPPGPSARDGFTRSSTDILYTRRGVTAKVVTPVQLPNGLQVFADGTIRFPDGSRGTLGSNQLLTFDGRVAETPLSPNGTAPVSPTVPGRPTGRPVVTPVDGITMVAGQAMVAHGGVQGRVVTELRFENGLRVRPNGSMTLPNGSETTLREDQMVNLRGEIVEAPVRYR